MRVRLSTPQFNTSVPLLDHTFSAPKIPQFHPKNPWGGTEGVELRVFWCGTEGGGTEGFLMWN